MIKNLLLPITAFITLVMLVSLGACSNEEIILDTESGSSSGRTLLLIAAMPTEGPATRVALTQEADKTVTLTWEVGDKLQLAFVQGTTKVKHTVTLTTENITRVGKVAKFGIDIPVEIEDGAPFDLYGVYGGGKRKIDFDIGLPGDNEPGSAGISIFYTGDALELGEAGVNPYIKLPTNAGSATSLADIQKRKDALLYFESTDIDLAKPDISVMFQHLGSLFSITLKNIGDTSLENLQGAQLVGTNNPDNQNWAFNGAKGGQTYDLVTKEFKTTAEVGNLITFRAAQSSLPAESNITFWAWYPPMPTVQWPELQLQLKDGTTNTIATSANSMSARTSATPAGRAYYFYATWDGAELNFTNPSFTNENTVHVKTMGTLGTLLSATKKANTTKLTLTGQINKVDYEVMKNQMPSLTHVDLSQVTSYEGEIENRIPDAAFGDSENENKTITTVILPESVTSIGSVAFGGCTSLTGTLELPAGLISIGYGAFKDCVGLNKSLTIPTSVTSIGRYAFNNCKFTGDLALPPNLTSIESNTFANCGFTGTLTLPTNLTTIEENAFANCSGFTGNLTLPSGLTAIGVGAFQQCSGFSGNLALPAGITSIGDDAFVLCTGFKGTLTLPISLTSIGMNAFYSCGFTGSLTIPADVTTIKSYAFYNCMGFDGPLVLPEGLTSIGSEALSSCGFTGTLTLPSSLKIVAEQAFHDCGRLGGLIIPEGVQTIGNGAFYNCNKISSTIIFPSTLTSIGSEGFDGCESVNEFQFLNPTPIEYTGNMLHSGKTVRVPTQAAVAEYLTMWDANASRHNITVPIE